MARIAVGLAVVVAFGVGAPALAAPAPFAAPPPQQGTCLDNRYTDPAGDGAVDAVTFGISYNCVYDGWRFDTTVASSDPFTFGNLSMEFDTDNNSADGCNGFDYLIRGSVATTGPIHWVTRMWRTPSCSPSTFLATGSASFAGVNNDFWINVSQADLGDPGVLGWRASLSNLAGNSVDFLPDSGSLTATGYPTISDSYWVVDGAGHVQAYGMFTRHGDLSGHPLASPIVGMARVPDLGGYWLLGRDGGVFSYGSARFYGSTGNLRLNSPVVSMVSTPSGHGYWFVASDGGIFSYGDTKFYGSTGNIRLNRPIVSIAPTPSGHGYWLVASDGGVFSFGDAKFYGSTGNIHLARPIVAMASTPSGHGYWFVASDGGVFGYGDAHYYGSTGSLHLAQPIVAMRASHSGHGYRFVATNGGVYNYGDARHYTFGPDTGPPIGTVVGIG
jgi:ribosomal protein L24E